MKSLYFAVVIAMLGTLSVSLLLFLAISDHVEKRYVYPVFEAMDELELEHAREALDNSGPAAVAIYMQRLNKLFGASHYLLDARGLDVVSGENRSSLLPGAPIRKSRGSVNNRFVVTHESPDNRYWFVAVNPREPNRWTFFPYYLLVLAATGILAWLTAIGVISPIRKVTASLDRFGAGDLDARINTHRKDEIGALAKSFDAMAERLQRLIRSERRLLEDISHELRSPLARLQLAVRLAKTAPDPHLALERVQRQVTRITSLVSQIIELTRIEGDPQMLQRAPVALMDLVREIISDCRLEAEFRGCHIDLAGEINRCVSGNRELLRRAIENVIRNAIRYSPEESVISIVARESASEAAISIRDQGTGVPEQTLERIFDPFFRVEEARDAETGGIGLGLSIARRALLLHEGTITARNAAPGLSVEITIPLKRDV